MRLLFTILLSALCASVNAHAQRISDLIQTNKLAHSNLMMVVTRPNQSSGNQSITFSNLTKEVTHPTTDWHIWTDGTLYYAYQCGSGFKHSSNDFAGLFQTVNDNTTLHGASYFIGPIDRNDTANRLFHCLRTVILTKAACIFGTGNPSTQFWQPDGASGVMIQVGDTENSIPGIWDMRNIRFQSEIGEVDSVGVKLVNVAEPNFRQCEFNNFGKSGLEFSNPINIWTGVYDSWFVTPEGGTGILFNGTAVTDSEADITLCKFGGLGDGITIDGLYQNIDITSCRFRYDGGTLNRAIRVIKGIGIGITNPRFIAWPETRRPILFTDRAASTNLNSFVSLAHGSYSGSTNYVEIGANVLGVVVTNNIIRGAIRPHDQ